ncbi:unnamed protein product, partial [Ectocarpus sp. 4 AP-2014]
MQGRWTSSPFAALDHLDNTPHIQNPFASNLREKRNGAEWYRILKRTASRYVVPVGIVYFVPPFRHCELNPVQPPFLAFLLLEGPNSDKIAACTQKQPRHWVSGCTSRYILGTEGRPHTFINNSQHNRTATQYKHVYKCVHTRIRLSPDHIEPKS